MSKNLWRILVKYIKQTDDIISLAPRRGEGRGEGCRAYVGACYLESGTPHPQSFSPPRGEGGSHEGILSFNQA